MRFLNVRTGSQKTKQYMKLTLQYGYTLKDIAEYIGVHYTTVSRAIKKIEGNILSDIEIPDLLVSYLLFSDFNTIKCCHANLD